MKYTLDATDYTDFRAIIEALAELPFQDETIARNPCSYCERDVRVLEMAASMIKNCLREAERKKKSGRKKGKKLCP